MSSDTVENPWIVNPIYDGFWFLGSVLVGFLMLLIVVLNASTEPQLLWIFACFFDGPHTIGTFVRTFFDKEEFNRRKRLYIGSLGWFFLGPLFLIFTYKFNNPIYFLAALNFRLAWGMFHVLRQNYGFFVLYQKKGGEAFGYSNKWDYYFYHLLWILSYALIISKSTDSQKLFGIEGSFVTAFHLLATFLPAGLVIIGGIYILREAVVCLKSSQINVLKNTFFVFSLSLPIFLALSKYSEILGATVISAILVIVHNVQYQGIVWHYSRSRYQQYDIQTGRNMFGLASMITRNISSFLFFIIVLGIILNYMEWKFPILLQILNIDLVLMATKIEPSMIALALFLGFPLQHYYLDQKIWRVSEDKKLEKTLFIHAAKLSSNNAPP